MRARGTPVVGLAAFVAATAALGGQGVPPAAASPFAAVPERKRLGRRLRAVDAVTPLTTFT